MTQLHGRFDSKFVNHAKSDILEQLAQANEAIFQ